MWNVIVCDGDEAECGLLMGFVGQYFEEKGKDVQITGCMDWPELESMVKQSLPDVVIVAQNGVDGLNTITSARLLSRKIIWFSDLDFGVQAYRLCVPYFSQKPVSYKKMEQALTRFLEVSPWLVKI